MVRTAVTGLSEAEASERRARGQGNNVQPVTSRSYAQILRENVFTFINNVLFGLGIALVLVGRRDDALVSVAVVLTNVIVSVVQEMRAKRTLDRIALLTRPKATVIRSGEEKTIDPAEIVIDDLLVVAAGDQIVVDGTVISAGQLDCDESLLTGFSKVAAAEPELTRTAIIGRILPQTQTALTIFSVSCGLLLIVFAEPPTEFWTGGDVLSGDWPPTYLALLLAVAFGVVLIWPDLRLFFEFQVLAPGEYLGIGLVVLGWAIGLRFIWRRRLFERFLNLEAS